MTYPLHSLHVAHENTAVVMIDMQEKLAGAMKEDVWAITQRNANTFLSAAKLFEMPVVVTEQYPKGLGATREEIAKHLPEGCHRFEKTSFSAWGAPGVAERLRELGRDQVVVTGIETHVCVGQTVHDLLAQGLQPHLVRDAVTARFALEDEVGFAKMTGSGAVPASAESVLFEWLGDARAPAFKAVQKLVV